MTLAVIVTTFALIFPAEFPDKTFIATLVLATRFRHLWVWIGVSLAFIAQVAIAVIAGGFLALLPQRLVLGATFVLFVIGAIILIRGGLASRSKEQADEAEEAEEFAARVASAQATRPLRILAVSFVVLFTAEWGDLSQILTAGLAARTGEPLSVGIGSAAALIAVAGIAVLAGRWLQARVPIWRIRIVSGVVLAALAIWTLTEFVRG